MGQLVLLGMRGAPCRPALCFCYHLPATFPPDPGEGPSLSGLPHRGGSQTAHPQRNGGQGGGLLGLESTVDRPASQPGEGRAGREPQVLEPLALLPPHRQLVPVNFSPYHWNIAGDY